MLCQKCQSKAATIHITKITDEKMERRDFCTECAPICANGTPEVELSQFLVPHKHVASTFAQRAENSPYSKEAFGLIGDVIKYAQALLRKEGNVTGSEILQAFRLRATVFFGKNAKAKLADWGIRQTEDVGVIIYRLVEAGLLAKQPTGLPNDFSNGYDFDEAFPKIEPRKT